MDAGEDSKGAAVTAELVATVTASASAQMSDPSVAATVATLPDPDPEFHWGRRQIHALIKNVEHFFEDFYDGTKKKKMIWRAVAERMRAEGHNCTGDECDKKWRNLKGSYVKVLQKQVRGETSYRFEYFDALHHILGKEIDPLGMREQAMSRPQEEEGGAEYHEITVDGNFVWTETAVHVLLDLVLEHREMMHSSDYSQEVWESIGHQISVECNEVDGSQCQRKWANLQEGFQFYQTEAELTASVPLWPFYTRVRHVMMTLNLPVSQVQVDRKPIIALANPPDSPPRKPRGTISVRSSLGGLGASAGASAGPALASGVRGAKAKGLLGRVKQLDSNMSLSRRLDHLEARVETSRLQRETYKQTNSILTKVLAELRRINSALEQEQRYSDAEHHLENGPTSRQHEDQEPGSPNQGIIIVEAYEDL